MPRLRPCREIDGVPHYQCTCCGQWKAATEFYPLPPPRGRERSVRRCGVRPSCKACLVSRRALNRRGVSGAGRSSLCSMDLIARRLSLPLREVEAAHASALAKLRAALEGWA